MQWNTEGNRWNILVYTGKFRNNNWDVQAAQQNHIDRGNKYEIKFNITSSIDRVVKLGFRDPENGYKGFYDDITLKAGETKNIQWIQRGSEQSTETGGVRAALRNTGRWTKLGERILSPLKIFQQ